jgi:hypothetical protein
MALGCRAFFVFGHGVIFPIIHLAGLLMMLFIFIYLRIFEHLLQFCEYE